MSIEFTDVRRPTRLASTTQMAAMDIHGVLTFEPVGAGTRMTWAWDIRPRGMLAPVGPVVTWLGRQQEKRIWCGLKEYLEGAPSADVPAGRGAGPAGPRRHTAVRPVEIAEDVFLLPTGRGLAAANVYVLASGEAWVLVDTAWPRRGARDR